MSRANYDKDIESGEHCWQDLRVETGFGSYEEYLKACNAGYFGFYSLLSAFSDRSRQKRARVTGVSSCSIIDLTEQSDSTFKQTVQDFDEPETSSSAILYAVRHPPASVNVRILLWWVSDLDPLTPDLLNICGLALRIRPEFFEALDQRADRASTHWLRRNIDLPSQSTSMALGNQMITTARDYKATKINMPPVVVVVGWDDLHWGVEKNNLAGSPPSILRSFETLQSLPFSLAQANKSEPQMKLPREESIFKRTQLYARCLEEALKRARGPGFPEVKITVLCILALLELDARHIQAKVFSLRRVLIAAQWSHVDDSLKNERFLLRRHIEDSEAGQKQFLQFILSTEQCSMVSDERYLNTNRLWMDAMTEARLLELEVRDSMQLQVREASLRESKKSIELSTSQIQESKRGEKTYIPSLLFTNDLLVKICKVKARPNLQS